MYFWTFFEKNQKMAQKCEQFSHWPFCSRCFWILRNNWSPYVAEARLHAKAPALSILTKDDQKIIIRNSFLINQKAMNICIYINTYTYIIEINFIYIYIYISIFIYIYICIYVENKNIYIYIYIYKSV